MVKGVRYCGGPSVGLSDWATAGKSSANPVVTWPQLRDRTVIGTFRGRTAIALACQLLGIGPGDEVLVPAYNCGTEIDAILHSGASVAGYSISQRCELELADLIRRKSSRTRAVYVIHYFGWEQPVQELRAWCNREGLLLIEDCALALFSRGQTGSIGQLSDAAVYSLPKTLGLSHGGLLSLPASRIAAAPTLAIPGFRILAREIGSSAKSSALCVLDRLRLYGPMLAMRRRAGKDAPSAAVDEELADMPADYHFNPVTDANRALHPRVASLAGSVSGAEVVRRRRDNYVQLAAALAGIPGVEMLFNVLPEGVCPLSLPLLVDDRDVVVKKLQAKGIAALPWWAGFHRTSIEWSQFPDAVWLKRHLLTLPVHQGLGVEQMDYIAKNLREEMT